MSRYPRTIAFGLLSIVWGSLSVQAETLRCTSINGNLNCVGSNGVSCQTVDGKRVCVSGHGDVVQSFGNGQPGRDGMDDVPLPRAWRKLLPHRWGDSDKGRTKTDPDWPTDSDD